VVVDDHEDTAETFAHLLMHLGCAATFVTDARDAVAEVLHAKPDIVFLDIAMPHINGYQLATALRLHFDPDALKIVAVTAYGATEDRLRSRKAGFDAHVTKPVDPAMLQSILRTVLQLR
jgi:CheY-like chemotaxis protein